MTIRAASKPVATAARGPESLIARIRNTGLADADSLADLAASVKADLRRRFALGEQAEVTEYLARHPRLRSADERVLSLIYEEYCLLEEHGAGPDPDEFCRRYDPWRDSLASQLRYHAGFSQAVGTSPRVLRFPNPGDQFDRFELEEELGHGGSARVYRAVEKDLGERPVALKISADRGDEPAIHGRLDHPHIVPVLSVVREPQTGLRGLCMPYWPGVPLDRVIDHVQPASASQRASALIEAVHDLIGVEEGGVRELGPSWRDFPTKGTYCDGVAWLGVHLAEALAHAHSRLVLHRDLKPANVLLTLRGGPLLLDFNLAHAPHAPEQAQAAHQGGTLPYMAPEQLAAFVDPKCWDAVGTPADLYSLGLVLDELLTGRRPKGLDHGVSLNRAILDWHDLRITEPRGPHALNPTVPRGLDAIVRRCLAPRPDSRYTNASALAEDLRCYLQRAPLRHATNPSRREVALNWVRRHRRGLRLVAGTLMAAAAVTVLARSVTRLSADEYLALGQKALAARHLEDAREHMHKALGRNPKLHAAEAGLGKADLADEQYPSSLGHFNKAIDLAETNHVGGGAVADAYLGRAEAAILWARALVDASRRSPGLDRAKSSKSISTRLASGEAERLYGQALEDLEQARGLSNARSTQFVVHVLSAKRQAGLGDLARFLGLFKEARLAYDEGERETRLALEPFPSNQDALKLQAELALCLGRLDLQERNLAAAHESVSRALALALGPPRLLEGDRLALVYVTRAEASLLRGSDLNRREFAFKDRLKKSGHTNPIASLPPLAEADDHFLAALGDLEAARVLATEPKTRTLVALFTGCAAMGLGDTASRRDQYDRSCPRYTTAANAFADVLEIDPGHREALTYQAGIRARMLADHCSERP
jgi:serine/threonine protein kinase